MWGIADYRKYQFKVNMRKRQIHREKEEFKKAVAIGKEYRKIFEACYKYNTSTIPAHEAEKVISACFVLRNDYKVSKKEIYKESDIGIRMINSIMRNVSWWNMPSELKDKETIRIEV